MCASTLAHTRTHVYTRQALLAYLQLAQRYKQEASSLLDLVEPGGVSRDGDVPSGEKKVNNFKTHHPLEPEQERGSR